MNEKPYKAPPHFSAVAGTGTGTAENSSPLPKSLGEELKSRADVAFNQENSRRERDTYMESLRKSMEDKIIKEKDKFIKLADSGKREITLMECNNSSDSTAPTMQTCRDFCEKYQTVQGLNVTWDHSEERLKYGLMPPRGWATGRVIAQW